MPMNVGTITASELKSMMERCEEFVLLDARNNGNAKERIPGSMNISLRELPSRLGELDASKTIVVYCSHVGCRTSSRAAEMLRARGLTALEFREGVLGWKEAGFLVMDSARGEGY